MFGSKRLGEILVSHGVVTPQQIAECLEFQASAPDRRLGEILVERECAKDIDVLRALGLQFGMEVRESFDLEAVDMTLSKDYNYAVAMRELIMPFEARNGFVLTAIVDPLNLDGLDVIRVMTEMEPVPVLAPRDVVKKLIAGIFDKRGDLANMAENLDTQKPAGEEEEAEKIQKTEKGGI